VKKEKAEGKLGRAIKELRAKKGISQETLAFESGLHRTYVGSAERGERNISINDIGRIADGMGAEPGRLPGVRPNPTDGPSRKIMGNKFSNNNF